jgi:hypothetical protein
MSIFSRLFNRPEGESEEGDDPQDATRQTTPELMQRTAADEPPKERGDPTQPIDLESEATKVETVSDEVMAAAAAARPANDTGTKRSAGKPPPVPQAASAPESGAKRTASMPPTRPSRAPKERTFRRPSEQAPRGKQAVKKAAAPTAAAGQASTPPVAQANNRAIGRVKLKQQVAAKRTASRAAIEPPVGPRVAMRSKSATLKSAPVSQPPAKAVRASTSRAKAQQKPKQKPKPRRASATAAATASSARRAASKDAKVTLKPAEEAVLAKSSDDLRVKAEAEAAALTPEAPTPTTSQAPTPTTSQAPTPTTSQAPTPPAAQPPAQPSAEAPVATVVAPHLDAAPKVEEADLEAVQALFDEMAAGYMRQVRDFMMEVRWGEPQLGWIDASLPVVNSMSSMADKMERKEMSSALEAFGKALEVAAEEGGSVIKGAVKDKLLKAYRPLIKLMPAAFELEAERNRREPIIVRSLLLSVPGVHKVVVDKVYAAGLSSLSGLVEAKPDELATVSGIKSVLAEQIVEKFADYKRTYSGDKPDPKRTIERRRLATLLSQLRSQHEEFERVRTSWSDEARSRKKSLRRAREETLLSVSVVMARLGEVDNLSELEKLPYHRKISTLEGLLAQTEATLGAPS